MSTVVRNRALMAGPSSSGGRLGTRDEPGIATGDTQPPEYQQSSRRRASTSPTTNAGLSLWIACLSTGCTPPPAPIPHQQSPTTPTDNLTFWSRPRAGANFFNNIESHDRFLAARNTGIKLARLAPNKWLNGRLPHQTGEFLLGPVDAPFDTLPPDDIALLRHVLDDAADSGLAVVLTMLSLPGRRWSQHNCPPSTPDPDRSQCPQERRLWLDPDAHLDAAHVWRQLADEFHSHPAVVAYDILNEPAPEFVPPRLTDWNSPADYQAWASDIAGTPADLNLFYATVIDAIREVDPTTPIVVEPGFFATPWALPLLAPEIIADDRIIYSFHMYEPALYTAGRQQPPYGYPGPIPIGEHPPDPNADPHHPPPYWDRQALERFFAPIDAWRIQHAIPPTRIYVSEFGLERQAPGAPQFLYDLLAVIQHFGWHWSFYSYREDDGFPAMDYELGTGPTPAKYWSSFRGEGLPGDDVYRANGLFSILEDALRTTNHR